jgi:hypothetical protein
LNTKAQGDVLQDISGKLDVIIAFLAVRGLEKDTAALVEKLTGMGFGAKVIARVAGTSENAIAIRLSRMKKKTPGKSKQKSSTEPTSEQ